MNKQFAIDLYNFNLDRDRRYGLRVGDLVKIGVYKSSGRKEYAYGIVVDLSGSNNNRAFVAIWGDGKTEVREFTAEECEVIQERN